MSKKNLVVIFLLLSGVLVALAYAAGSRSNRLSNSQISFTDKASSAHGNKLTATVWDALMNGLTTRATNHESRLQAFAQVPGYPNLTQQETTFTDLLSTKNANQLTAQMRDGFLSRLTKAVTNHEMRLRQAETATPPSPTPPSPETPKVDGKCGTTVGQCSTGKPIAGSAANIWHCEGSNGGTTAYNCQVVLPEYECVGTYDTGRKMIQWNGKRARLNCFVRSTSRYGGRHRQSASGCPEDNVSGILGENGVGGGDPDRGGPEQGRSGATEYMRGFRDPTDKSSKGGPRSAHSCLSKAIDNIEGDQDFNVFTDVECSYACTKNPDSHLDKCNKKVEPIMEDCSSFNQTRCSSTPGCTRKKK